LGGDTRSLLTIHNSIDFQSITHFFRAGILSIEGDWGAIAGLPIGGEVLAVTLNLQREFFINPDSVFSAI